MGKIDTIGTYKGVVLEHGLALTKNGFPQLVIKVQATEKYIDSPAELKHYELETEQYIDWSEFDETTTGFLVLFKDNEEFTEETALMNYEQVQLALGWDGQEFDDLNGEKFVGKEVLFRMEENFYNEQTTIRLNWIDAADAPPNRELMKLDATKLAALPKIKVGGKTAKPAAAKAAKPGKPSAAASSPTATKGAKPSTSETAPSKPAPSTAPKATKTPPKATAESPADDRPDAVSQGDAWEYVCNHKGGNSDNDIEQAWIESVQEISGDNDNLDESEFTEQLWAKVRDLVVKDLALGS
jgi:hypothetical protein